MSDDIVQHWLNRAARTPLLTTAEEISFGRQVQELMALQGLERELTDQNGVAPSRAELAEDASSSSLRPCSRC